MSSTAKPWLLRTLGEDVASQVLEVADDTVCGLQSETVLVSLKEMSVCPCALK